MHSTQVIQKMSLKKYNKNKYNEYKRNFYKFLKFNFLFKVNAHFDNKVISINTNADFYIS